MNRSFTSRAVASLSAIVALSTPCLANAQEASLPAAVIPTLDCPNPGPLPADTSGTAPGRFQKKVNDYQSCVNTYAKAQSAKANEYSAQAQAYNDAANKAVDDFNAYAHQLNEQQKSRK